MRALTSVNMRVMIDNRGITMAANIHTNDIDCTNCLNIFSAWTMDISLGLAGQVFHVTGPDKQNCQG